LLRKEALYEQKKEKRWDERRQFLKKTGIGAGMITIGGFNLAESS
jgi:hypothetical protein